MKLVRVGLFLVAALVAQATTRCEAARIDLKAVDRGWYNPSHDPRLDNYIVGRFGAEYRNFTVYELDDLGEPIVSAKLKYRNDPVSGYESRDPFERFAIFDVTSSIADLVNGSGGIAAFDDLGSGVVYATRRIGSEVGGTVTVRLDALAVAALNSSTGLLAFGGALLSLDSRRGDEYLFGFSGGAPGDTKLVLNATPLPAAAPLLLAGMLALAALRRRSWARR